MREFSFDLDAAADSETSLLPRYLSDALDIPDWPGKRIWLNRQVAVSADGPGPDSGLLQRGQPQPTFQGLERSGLGVAGQVCAAA